MITVFFRTLIIYIILIGTMRLMGKRQIGELEVSELVTTLMISELCVIPIIDKHIPVTYAIVPIFILLSVEVITSFIISKNDFAKKLLYGTPSIIVLHGKINQRELSRLRIGIGELFCELRQKNISHISDVEYAILEDNGKLSVITKAEKTPVVPDDIDITVSEPGIEHPIIADGRINYESLAMTGHDKKWLKKKLASENAELSSVFLMTIDDIGKTQIILKEKGAKNQ